LGCADIIKIPGARFSAIARLSKRNRQPWGEFWNAVGFDTEQPKELSDAAQEVGFPASTVSR